jgi:hypothetical protein
MPKGIDWINFIYVNLGYFSLVFIMFYFGMVVEIKKDWPKYRCNPMFMPLSDNLEQDFVYCVQSMQTNFMGYLLQPINYIVGMLSNMGGNFTVSLDFVRTMISNIRTFFTSIVQNIFGVFLNLVIEFQKITISIKDLVGKIIGVMVTIMYLIDGSVKTMQSTWNGPPGQMVRALGGNCFHPETKVKLKNGPIVNMKDLNLGDILENGSRVDVLMTIDNKLKENFYKFPGKGPKNSDIYVTGSHMIFSDSQNKFIEVKDHPDAIITKDTHSYFSSLITDNHKIKLGECEFWDWEDDILKLN